VTVVLDHNLPRGPGTVLASFEVRPAFEMGWHEPRDGDLLLVAERDGFDIPVTPDKNIRPRNRHGGMPHDRVFGPAREPRLDLEP